MATNPINPMQLFKIISKQQNPQQFMCNMLQEHMGDNPVMANLLSLAQNNNGAEIETVARNLFKEKGLDFDKEFSKFKNMLGIK